MKYLACVSVTALLLGLSGPAMADAAGELIVRGDRADAPKSPATSESVSAAEALRTTSVVTPEDVLKYTPNVLIRQRHIGDTQSPITTRTSGVGASARSLIYVDGILLSALIGNNNSTASPKWGLIAPEAIARVDVLYGPFDAAYAGNSIGSVVNFTTRMPKAFEATLQVQGALQDFRKYGDDDSYGTSRLAGSIGNRFGKLALRLSYNRLDSHSQPLGYVTAAVPAANATTGLAVTGAFDDASRLGAPIKVLGATGLEHQVQDNLSGRLTYDLSDHLTAAYTFGLFHNADDARVHSYLKDASGAPIYSGALNMGGKAYTVAASAFSNGYYNLEELQLAQGLSLASQSGGAFDFELVATSFDNLINRQRLPGTALPAAANGGTGSVVALDNTGWYTFDAKGIWRAGSGHVITFGAHQDGFTLKNPRFALTDWMSGPRGTTQTYNQGRTETKALWVEDAITLNPFVDLTLGVRQEDWRSYDGLNYSASPALNKTQPELKASALSPKAVLSVTPTTGTTFKASFGIANRFPTVSELYQAVTVGTSLQTPNPDLKPERATSSELSFERILDQGRLRVSLFNENIKNTLLSQTAPIATGSTVLASFVQNVDKTHATGLEVVASQKDVLLKGLELSGWATFVDARIDADTAFPAAVGKRLPQLPQWRGSLTATYQATQALSLSVSGRYADRAFGTIDNSDPYANTYQGFSGYFVLDATARYQINPRLSAGLGVNNLNNRAYFLFHPFPQRTLIADLKYVY